MSGPGTEPEPHTRGRHWPRDAPVRWGAFVRGLSFQVVAVVAVAAHLVLGVVSIAAILGTAIDGVGEWLLAVAWGGSALWQVRAWWFRRSSIVLPPLGIGALVAILVALSG